VIHNIVRRSASGFPGKFIAAVPGRWCEDVTLCLSAMREGTLRNSKHIAGTEAVRWNEVNR
jgi:hypothetical protein